MICGLVEAKPCPFGFWTWSEKPAGGPGWHSECSSRVWGSDFQARYVTSSDSLTQPQIWFWSFMGKKYQIISHCVSNWSLFISISRKLSLLYDTTLQVCLTKWLGLRCAADVAPGSGLTHSSSSTFVSLLWRGQNSIIYVYFDIISVSFGISHQPKVKLSLWSGFAVMVLPPAACCL